METIKELWGLLLGVVMLFWFAIVAVFLGLALPLLLIAYLMSLFTK